MTPGAGTHEVSLVVSGVSKRFGATHALRDVSFRVRRGTVHALLGENGAGKSTLVRAAFGLVPPDSGRVTAGDPPRPIGSAAAAIGAGLGMVHQHFTNVPAMTVAENVMLGGRGAFSGERAAARVTEIARRTGLALDPTAIAGELSVGAQQRLEIVKALSREATTLLLDEPTAVLAPDEATELLWWLRGFADRGGAVVLITHRLREALAIADDVTVLRRGAVVLAGPAESYDERALAAALLGVEDERPEAVVSETPHAGAGERPVVARLVSVDVTDERGVRIARDVNLVARGGEVLGIAAVEGSGQRGVLRVLAGRVEPDAGRAELPSSIGFVPEDRQRDALVLELSLTENVALRGAGARRGRLDWRDQRRLTDELIQAFDVRANTSGDRAATLSGGNQQKLVLARELSDSPELLVAENPTRGLDIRATREVHARLRAAARRGAAVVVHSSDLDEVLALADRVVVMHAGAMIDVSGRRDVVGRAMLGVA